MTKKQYLKKKADKWVPPSFDSEKEMFQVVCLAYDDTMFRPFPPVHSQAEAVTLADEALIKFSNAKESFVCRVTAAFRKEITIKKVL